LKLPPQFQVTDAMDYSAERKQEIFLADQFRELHHFNSNFKNNVLQMPNEQET
jgi:hypothetical protein